MARWWAVGLSALVGGFVANQIWYERRRRVQHREMTSELDKWEGEGGNVPYVRGNVPEPQEAPRNL